MTAETTTIPTRLGPFTIIATRDAVTAAGWTDDADALVPVMARSLRPSTLTPRRDLGAFSAAARAYHEGDVTAIDDIPVHQTSGPFLEHAWDVLRTVPAGAPITYAAFAERCGHPTAIRAAAAACGRNAIALFVPCHRVLRTGGALGGFRWGLSVKCRLLDHEAAAVAP